MKTETIIGKSVGFEDENEEIKWTGKITKVEGNRVFIDGPKHIKGWYSKDQINFEE